MGFWSGHAHQVDGCQQICLDLIGDHSCAILHREVLMVPASCWWESTEHNLLVGPVVFLVRHAFSVMCVAEECGWWL